MSGRGEQTRSRRGTRRTVLRLTRLVGVTTVALCVSAPAVAHAGNTSTGSMAATQALVMHGSFDKPDRNSSSLFGTGIFVFVVPRGACVAGALGPDVSGSVEPRVDLCQPWAGFTANAVKVSSDWSNGHTTGCAQISNTPSFSDGYPVTEPHWRNNREIKPRSGMYFDVTCKVPENFTFGRDYDFLRVVIDAANPWLFDEIGPIWVPRAFSDTSRVELGVGDDNAATESVVSVLYGHDSSGFHEISRGWGRGQVMASHVTATIARLN